MSDTNSSINSDSGEADISGAPGERAAADLNGDGRIGAAEAFVARVGEVDAALEARAKQGGIIGAAAGLLHKVLDTVDGDDTGSVSSDGDAQQS